jgi:hypothetical protein
MENYPTGVGQRPETLERYIRSLNLPDMKPWWIPRRSSRAEGTRWSFFRTDRGSCHLHLSDYKDGKKHLPIGQGTISWGKVFAVLKEKGYSGYYTLEPAYRYYLKDIPSRLARDFEYLSGLV